MPSRPSYWPCPRKCGRMAPKGKVCNDCQTKEKKEGKT